MLVALVVIFLATVFWYTKETFSTYDKGNVDYPTNYLVIDKFVKITSDVVNIPAIDKYTSVSFTETLVFQSEIIAELERFLSEKFNTPVQNIDKKLRGVYIQDAVEAKNVIFTTTIVHSNIQYIIRVFCVISSDFRVTIKVVESAEPRETFTLKVGKPDGLVYIKDVVSINDYIMLN